MAGLRHLAHLDRALADNAPGRRADGGVFQVQLRLFHCRLHLLNAGGGGFRTGACDRHLLRSRAGRRDRGLRLCKPRLLLGHLALRHPYALFGLAHLGLGQVDLRAIAPGGGDRQIVLLLRDLFLSHQGLHAVQVARGPHVVGLGYPDSRLRRTQPVARGVHLVLRGGHGSAGFSDTGLGPGKLAGRGSGNDRYLCLVDVQGGLHFRQVRARAIQGHLVVLRVDLHQHRPGIHVLVVLYHNLERRSPHACAHRVQVAIDLRVVRRFVDRREAQISDAGYGKNCQHQQAGRPFHPQKAPWSLRGFPRLAFPRRLFPVDLPLLPFFPGFGLRSIRHYCITP